jgi:uncharacterized protein (DUF1778 family)
MVAEAPVSHRSRIMFDEVTAAPCKQICAPQLVRNATMPSAQPSTASARINLRTSPEAKALIERAAALMGTTVSGFMVQNAYEAARRIVADNETLVLSLALSLSRQIGLYAVLVDAKHEHAAAFYRRLGFETTLDNGLCLYLPVSRLA